MILDERRSKPVGGRSRPVYRQDVLDLAAQGKVDAKSVVYIVGTSTAIPFSEWERMTVAEMAELVERTKFVDTLRGLPMGTRVMLVVVAIAVLMWLFW